MEPSHRTNDNQTLSVKLPRLTLYENDLLLFVFLLLLEN